MEIRKLCWYIRLAIVVAECKACRKCMVTHELWAPGKKIWTLTLLFGWIWQIWRIFSQEYAAKLIESMSLYSWRYTDNKIFLDNASIIKEHKLLPTRVQNSPMVLTKISRRTRSCQTDGTKQYLMLVVVVGSRRVSYKDRLLNGIRPSNSFVWCELKNIVIYEALKRIT